MRSRVKVDVQETAWLVVLAERVFVSLAVTRAAIEVAFD
jgi:hypothetical protein